MSDREVRLECLKAAVATPQSHDLVRAANEFWEFVSSGQSHSERPRTEQPSLGTRSG
jgi:hypothetical protein